MGLLTAPLTLVRAPVRVALKATEVGLSTAAEVARIGSELLNPDSEGAHDFSEYRAQPDTGPANGAAPEVDLGTAAAGPVADAPPPIPDELIPDHVDEDVVLVAEIAEEGAEDGAGPELTVEPPWDGYDQMTAADIRDRLALATAVEAAAVELYESIGKNRRTVMDAAARALRD
ncbi:MAG TPA: hypothetical protein VF072_09505 [Thermoleophilaceae bacterium]